MCSSTSRAAAAAFLTRLRSATAPAFMVVPSSIIASKVVSPFSSGDPPYPTEPSHCSTSHTAQPAVTASNAGFACGDSCIAAHARAVALGHGQVLITIGTGAFVPAAATAEVRSRAEINLDMAQTLGILLTRG